MTYKYTTWLIYYWNDRYIGFLLSVHLEMKKSKSDLIKILLSSLLKVSPRSKKMWSRGLQQSVHCLVSGLCRDRTLLKSSCKLWVMYVKTSGQSRWRHEAPPLHPLHGPSKATCVCLREVKSTFMAQRAHRKLHFVPTEWRHDSPPRKSRRRDVHAGLAL